MWTSCFLFGSVQDSRLHMKNTKAVVSPLIFSLVILQQCFLLSQFALVAPSAVQTIGADSKFDSFGFRKQSRIVLVHSCAICCVEPPSLKANMAS